jgi:hypothetical protein
MAPLRTAVTTAALCRATQRFVSGDGKSIAMGPVCSNRSPPVKSAMLASRACRGELAKDFADIWRSNERFVINVEVTKGSEPLSAEPFDPSLDKSLGLEIVSKKFENLKF